MRGPAAPSQGPHLLRPVVGGEQKAPQKQEEQEGGARARPPTRGSSGNPLICKNGGCCSRGVAFPVRVACQLHVDGKMTPDPHI